MEDCIVVVAVVVDVDAEAIKTVKLRQK